MNIINRKTVFICVALLLSGNSFAQEQTSEIDMPDLTTVVTGNSTESFDIPTPDFDTVIKVPGIEGEIVTQLPPQSAEDLKGPSDADFSGKDKTIFAEGQIGGGYPATFIGDFKVSRIFGNNPFKLSFNHLSTSGFANHSLYAGYNATNTAIDVNKVFTGKKTKWNLNAGYEDIGNGLQGKTEGIGSIKQDLIKVQGDLDWTLPKGFSTGFDLKSNVYFRYADIAKNTATDFVCEDWVKNTTDFSISPVLFAKWAGKGFSLGLDAGYSFEGGFGSVNRGEFGFDFAWKNDYVKLYSDVALVTGDKINCGPIVVPFNVGIKAFLPVSFSDRKVEMELCGGLKSTQTCIYDYEKKYKFTGFSGLAGETSNWNTNFELLFPIGKNFSLNGGVEYFFTAFNNGTWMPVYDQEHLVNGVYTYEQKNVETLATKVSLSYKIMSVVLCGGWNSYWFDVPAMENGQTVYFNASYRTASGFFGADADFIYGLDSSDKVPELNMDVFIQATPAVTFMLKSNDFIKLVTGKERTYAGDYISKSGDVTLLVKFLF